MRARALALKDPLGPAVSWALYGPEPRLLQGFGLGPSRTPLGSQGPLGVLRVWAQALMGDPFWLGPTGPQWPWRSKGPLGPSRAWPMGTVRAWAQAIPGRFKGLGLQGLPWALKALAPVGPGPRTSRAALREEGGPIVRVLIDGGGMRASGWAGRRLAGQANRQVVDTFWLDPPSRRRVSAGRRQRAMSAPPACRARTSGASQRTASCI